MYNTILNPAIWTEQNQLKDGIAEAIAKIVQQFVDDLPIDIDIVDIRLVGSNASYNYNANSDIDVHLVVNTDILPYESKIVKLLYNSARNKFNKDYSMTIKGLPVEISIEDIKSNVCSNGVYSLTTKEWIKEPQAINVEVTDMTDSEQYIKLYDKITEILLHPTSKDIKDMINQLYMIRKNSILTDGEFGKGNLLFKAIRNAGLLEKLKEELYNILSKELTFESMLENLTVYQVLDKVEDR